MLSRLICLIWMVIVVFTSCVKTGSDEEKTCAEMHGPSYRCVRASNCAKANRDPELLTSVCGPDDEGVCCSIVHSHSNAQCGIRLPYMRKARCPQDSEEEISIEERKQLKRHIKDDVNFTDEQKKFKKTNVENMENATYNTKNVITTTYGKPSSRDYDLTTTQKINTQSTSTTVEPISLSDYITKESSKTNNKHVLSSTLQDIDGSNVNVLVKQKTLSMPVTTDSDLPNVIRTVKEKERLSSKMTFLKTLNHESSTTNSVFPPKTTQYFHLYQQTKPMEIESENLEASTKGKIIKNYDKKTSFVSNLTQTEKLSDISAPTTTVVLSTFNDYNAKEAPSKVNKGNLLTSTMQDIDASSTNSPNKQKKLSTTVKENSNILNVTKIEKEKLLSHITSLDKSNQENSTKTSTQAFSTQSFQLYEQTKLMGNDSENLKSSLKSTIIKSYDKKISYTSNLTQTDKMDDISAFTTNILSIFNDNITKEVPFKVNNGNYLTSTMKDFDYSRASSPTKQKTLSITVTENLNILNVTENEKEKLSSHITSLDKSNHETSTKANTQALTSQSFQLYQQTKPMENDSENLGAPPKNTIIKTYDKKISSVFDLTQTDKLSGMLVPTTVVLNTVVNNYNAKEVPVKVNNDNLLTSAMQDLDESSTSSPTKQKTLLMSVTENSNRLKVSKNEREKLSSHITSLDKSNPETSSKTSTQAFSTPSNQLYQQTKPTLNDSENLEVSPKSTTIKAYEKKTSSVSDLTPTDKISDASAPTTVVENIFNDNSYEEVPFKVNNGNLLTSTIQYLGVPSSSPTKQKTQSMSVTENSNKLKITKKEREKLSSHRDLGKSNRETSTKTSTQASSTPSFQLHQQTKPIAKDSENVETSTDNTFVQTLIMDENIGKNSKTLNMDTNKNEKDANHFLYQATISSILNNESSTKNIDSLPLSTKHDFTLEKLAQSTLGNIKSPEAFLNNAFPQIFNIDHIGTNNVESTTNSINLLRKTNFISETLPYTYEYELNKASNYYSLPESYEMEATAVTMNMMQDQVSTLPSDSSAFLDQKYPDTIQFDLDTLPDMKYTTKPSTDTHSSVSTIFDDPSMKTSTSHKTSTQLPSIVLPENKQQSTKLLNSLRDKSNSNLFTTSGITTFFPFPLQEVKATENSTPFPIQKDKTMQSIISLGNYEITLSTLNNEKETTLTTASSLKKNSSKNNSFTNSKIKTTDSYLPNSSQKGDRSAVGKFTHSSENLSDYQDKNKETMLPSINHSKNASDYPKYTTDELISSPSSLTEIQNEMSNLLYRRKYFKRLTNFEAMNSQTRPKIFTEAIIPMESSKLPIEANFTETNPKSRTVTKSPKPIINAINSNGRPQLDIETVNSLEENSELDSEISSGVNSKFDTVAISTMSIENENDVQYMESDETVKKASSPKSANLSNKEDTESFSSFDKPFTDLSNFNYQDLESFEESNRLSNIETSEYVPSSNYLTTTIPLASTEKQKLLELKVFPKQNQMPFQEYEPDFTFSPHLLKDPKIKVVKKNLRSKLFRKGTYIISHLAENVSVYNNSHKFDLSGVEEFDLLKSRGDYAEETARHFRSRNMKPRPFDEKSNFKSRNSDSTLVKSRSTKVDKENNLKSKLHHLGHKHDEQSWKDSRESDEITPIRESDPEYTIGGKLEDLPWNWMCAIYLYPSFRFICGGTLIDDQHILSAAHCFFDTTKDAHYAVICGDLDRVKKYSTPKVYSKVEKVYVHQNFTPPCYCNDISLLRLEKPLSSEYNPICLPAVDPAGPGENGTVLGWGDTSFSNGDTSTKRLQRLDDVTIYPPNECRNIISRVAGKKMPSEFGEYYICAGVPDGSKDACVGDSGGPLMHEDYDGLWSLIGIVSFGYKCGNPGTPGTYTRVSYYMPWIMKHIQEKP